jgi:hypothetical protein
LRLSIKRHLKASRVRGQSYRCGSGSHVTESRALQPAGIADGKVNSEEDVCRCLAGRETRWDPSNRRLPSTVSNVSSRPALCRHDPNVCVVVSEHSVRTKRLSRTCCFRCIDLRRSITGFSSKVERDSVLSPRIAAARLHLGQISPNTPCRISPSELDYSPVASSTFLPSPGRHLRAK